MIDEKPDKNYFLDKFTVELAKFGFTKLRKKGYYARRCDVGTQRITVLFSSDLNLLRAGVSVRIVFDSLTDLFNEFYEHIGKEKIDEFSFGSNLGNIKSQVFREWHLYSNADIDQDLGEIVQIIRDFGLPFFVRYSSIAELFEGLVDPKMASRLLTFIGDRWRAILAVAYLSGDRQMFDSTFARGEKLLENHIQGEIALFRQLHDWLSGRQQEWEQERT